MGKNIWILNHYAGSPNHGMEFRHYYLAKEWIKRGYSVKIIAASFSHIRNVNVFSKKLKIEEEIDDIKFLWIKTSDYKGNGFKRLVNMFQYSFKLFWLSLFHLESKPDIVIATSPHPFVFVNAWFLRYRTKAKVIFEVRDLWPLTLIQINPKLRWNPVVGLMQVVENLAYKKCDVTVSLLPLAYNYMKMHGLEEAKFKYIPNGVSDRIKVSDELTPSEKNFFCNDLFKIGYAGNFGEANALCYLIEAFSKLQDYPIALYLIGDGPEKTYLESISANLSNIYFIPRTKHEKALGFLTLVDVCYIGLTNSKLFEFGVSPNKIFDYMFLKKPIVQSINAGNNIVEDAACGIAAKAEDTDSISEAILEIYDLSHEQRVKMGKNGYDYLVNNHMYSSLSKAFETCF